MAVHTNATAGAALGNELRAGTVAQVGSTKRIQALNGMLHANRPNVDITRARAYTKIYKQTEGMPSLMRRYKASAEVYRTLSDNVYDHEQLVGWPTQKIRGANFAIELHAHWLAEDLPNLRERTYDPFDITDEDYRELEEELLPYWKDKTMAVQWGHYVSQREWNRGQFGGVSDVSNYLCANGSHFIPAWTDVIQHGFVKYYEKAQRLLEALDPNDPESIDKRIFYTGILEVLEAIRDWGERLSAACARRAREEKDPVRKQELENMAAMMKRVPWGPATSFHDACETAWAVCFFLFVEGAGPSITWGRFDQYMYPYYKKDIESGAITRTAAQELLDCIWVKLNDLNKVRDAASAEGFAGYSLFQNLIVGGQDKDGNDVTNDLSFMCIEASMHVHLPAPSLSIRVWNGSPHDLLIKAAELTRTGIGLPAYYNDEVIIPALQNRGLSLADAREYNIIGCVEPQKAGKTEGWHDAAFFNMCRPLELVFGNGMDQGEMVGIPTGDVTRMETFDEFYDAYKKQMEYCISLLVNADNAIDVAHAKRCPLPFLSSMIDDCIARGKTVQEGGAVYNFTGPQGFGIANMADSLYAIRQLVYQEKKFTMEELKEALAWNYGKGLDEQSVKEITTGILREMTESGAKVDADTAAAVLKSVMNAQMAPEKMARYQEIHDMIAEVPKFGNDIPEVDYFARDVAYTYTRPLQNFKNPRGGQYQAGLYPVSANVPLGGQTGATPDGRYAHTPVADGVSPSAGKDVNGPTAAASSVAKLDHFIVSNGTLFNQKFHPSALSGREGLEKFVALIRSYFDQKGMHMQFNVVSRETLLDAQAHPENYKHLVVRVAGYSALFTTLSKSLQDDIIRRTEQGF